MSDSGRRHAFNEAGKSISTTDEKITDQIKSMGIKQGEPPEVTQKQSEDETPAPRLNMKGELGDAVSRDMYEKKQEQLWEAHRLAHPTQGEAGRVPESVEQGQSHLEPMDDSEYAQAVKDMEQKLNEQYENQREAHHVEIQDGSDHTTYAASNANDREAQLAQDFADQQKEMDAAARDLDTGYEV